MVLKVYVFFKKKATFVDYRFKNAQIKWNGTLKSTKQIQPDLDVIVMSAYGSVESAVDAMKEGAWDFISKPLHRDELLHSVRTALEKQDIHQENRQLKKKIANLMKDDWIGTSNVMQRLKEEAIQVADSLASVFLVGESGTGKGKLTKWIHKNSPYKESSLITLNCGAIPESLIESELFGHEKGAFTGAQSRRIGKFEQARNGTLFLDEITEMPIHLQVKLLRVLQEGEFERVGGNQTIHIQTRIIAATNQEPSVAIKQGKLREDLYYRLNVIQMRLPPLRERKEDIPLLVQYFIEPSFSKNNRSKRSCPLMPLTFYKIGTGLEMSVNWKMSLKGPSFFPEMKRLKYKTYLSQSEKKFQPVIT